MTARTRTRCSGCGKRIPASEPDLVLRRNGSEKQRFYHQRCLAAAQQVVLNSPAVWFLMSRFVNAEAN